MDWSASEAPALWRYNLHYFGYLEALSGSQRSAVCNDWILNNIPLRGVGWDAYPTSLRIIHWTKYAPSEPAIVNSLYRQAEYLSRFTERHLLGNHLLENARALMFAGNYFSDTAAGQKWLQQGIAIYRQQTPEQILRDGGHFERSPMYHALMLEGYLDAANLLPPGHPDRQFFARTSEAMLSFLAATTHPDGEISLFNDAVFDVAPSPNELQQYAGRVFTDGRAASIVGRASQFPDSGYYAFSGDRTFLLVDGGAIGPDHLPAHAHCDLFSYELSLDGSRFIVDSGVYEYAPGEMRAYCRSTRAHNTVQVDGVDHCEPWSSFRVARRFYPRSVSCLSDPGMIDFRGSFAGYRSLVGDDICVERSLRCTDERLQVEDTITGRGSHLCESFVHLHPAVDVLVEGDSLRLARGAAACMLHPHGGAVEVIDGWYCPRFGERIENKVIVLGTDGALPVRLGYEIDFRSERMPS